MEVSEGGSKNFTNEMKSIKIVCLLHQKSLQILPIFINKKKFLNRFLTDLSSGCCKRNEPVGDKSVRDLQEMFWKIFKEHFWGNFQSTA